MAEPHLLTLEEAAARAGMRKRDVRRLVVAGRLPAVRADGRWRIAVADLDRLPTGTTLDAPLTHAIVPVPESAPHPDGELPVVLAMLRERDRQISELQDERARLSSQVGFLLGRLSEREKRLQSLEQDLMAAGTVVRENLIATSPPEEDRPADIDSRSAIPAPALGETLLIRESSATTMSMPLLPPAPDPLPNDAGAGVIAHSAVQEPAPARKRNWLAVLIWGPYDS